MSDSFFSDLSQGFESGVDISAKLQNIRQSRDRFALQQHQIEQQQAMIDDQMGLQEAVGQQLANGKFSATELYKRYPRAYREIQDLQAQQAHLVNAGAAQPSAQIIQAIQSGDLRTADSILQSNADVIDKALGRPGAHIDLRHELRTDPQQVLERAKKSYVLAAGDPRAQGMGNTFDPKAQAQIQKLDQGYSEQVDKIQAQASATEQAGQALDTIIDNLQKAQKSPAIDDWAIYRGNTQNIAGADAKDLKELLSPVQAQAYVNAIAQAKSSGANIRITQNEVQVLAKGLGSLDLGQSSDQLQNNVKSILTKFQAQRSKLAKDHQNLQTKYQVANQKYNKFQQQSGMGGNPLTQSLLGDQGQGMQQPAGQMPATGAAPAAPAPAAGAAPAGQMPAAQPMADQTVPQSQVRQMQPAQAPAQAQGKQPTQDDLDYLAAHPETIDKFENYYGFNPLKSSN